MSDLLNSIINPDQKVETTPVEEVPKKKRGRPTKAAQMLAEKLKPASFGPKPPICLKRNEFGLLDNVSYFYNEDGTIDWRRMVKIEHLVPNSLNFQKRQIPVPNSIEGLDDDDLLITLLGLKELLHLRGFKSIKYKIVTANLEYVCAKCSILFLPNFETFNEAIKFEAIADASYNSVLGEYRNYLGALAENRAFGRCIRSFLRINITSKDEIGRQESFVESTQLSEKSKKLQNEMDRVGMSFSDLKRKLELESYPDINNLDNLDDLSPDKIFELLERLKKIKIAIPE